MHIAGANVEAMLQDVATEAPDDERRVLRCCRCCVQERIQMLLLVGRLTKDAFEGPGDRGGGVIVGLCHLSKRTAASALAVTA